MKKWVFFFLEFDEKWFYRLKWVCNERRENGSNKWQKKMESFRNNEEVNQDIKWVKKQEICSVKTEGLKLIFCEGLAKSVL